MSRNDRFLKACRRQPVDAIPVWLMRQAGRYMKEYRDLRARYSFLELCKTPHLAAQVTLQPVEAFEVDAAILFSDILMLIEAMGVEVRFEEKAGPILDAPLRSARAVRSLAPPDPEDDLGYVLEAVRIVNQALGGMVPLIGFSGAPFTLACYLLEGGSSKDFFYTKRMMYQEPEIFHELMGTLSSAVSVFLRAQAAAGAHVLQIFDTWATILSPSDYKEYVFGHMVRVVEETRVANVPLIYFSLGASTLLGLIKELGTDVLSLDWRIDLGEARKSLGPEIAVQGNLDPLALFKPPELLKPMVASLVEVGSQWPGYIFNLGHGLHPLTPVEQVRFLIETVHSCEPCCDPTRGPV